MVLERGLGDLRNVITAWGEADGTHHLEIKKYTQDILQCLDHMHSRRVAHNDIKPANLVQFLVNGVTRFKLIDFEFAADFGSIRSKEHTPHMCSPELAQHVLDIAILSRVSYQQDIWALGITVYWMRFGTRPFEHESTDGLLAMLANLTDAAIETLLTASFGRSPNAVNQMLMSFLRSCLAVNPSNRAQAPELLRKGYISDESASQFKRSVGPLLKEQGARLQSVEEDQAVMKQTQDAMQVHIEELWLSAQSCKEDLISTLEKIEANAKRASGSKQKYRQLRDQIEDTQEDISDEVAQLLVDPTTDNAAKESMYSIASRLREIADGGDEEINLRNIRYWMSELQSQISVLKADHVQMQVQHEQLWQSATECKGAVCAILGGVDKLVRKNFGGDKDSRRQLRNRIEDLEDLFSVDVSTMLTNLPDHRAAAVVHTLQELEVVVEQGFESVDISMLSEKIAECESHVRTMEAANREPKHACQIVHFLNSSKDGSEAIAASLLREQQTLHGIAHERTGRFCRWLSYDANACGSWDDVWSVLQHGVGKILHFGGHGDKKDRSLCFERDGILQRPQPEEFARELCAASPECIILNACDTYELARRIHLTNKDIVVIAWCSPVETKVCETFTNKFYEALAGALSRARQRDQPSKDCYETAFTRAHGFLSSMRELRNATNNLCALGIPGYPATSVTTVEVKSFLDTKLFPTSAMQHISNTLATFYECDAESSPAVHRARTIPNFRAEKDLHWVPFLALVLEKKAQCFWGSYFKCRAGPSREYWFSCGKDAPRLVLTDAKEFVSGLVVLHIHFDGTNECPNFDLIKHVNIRFACDHAFAERAMVIKNKERNAEAQSRLQPEHKMEPEPFANLAAAAMPEPDLKQEAPTAFPGLNYCDGVDMYIPRGGTCLTGGTKNTLGFTKHQGREKVAVCGLLELNLNYFCSRDRNK